MSGERFVSIDEIESVIRLLRDVLSVRVVADQRGAIQEIHVLVSGNRAPKQTVRDIESAVMAKLGVAVDHRKISVAQLQTNEPPAVAARAQSAAVPRETPRRASSGRLQFSDVTFSFNGSRAQATVRLKEEDRVFTGTAEGANTAHNQLRLVATATLAAVQQAWRGRGTYVVEDVSASLRLAGQNVVVALIDVLTDRGQETLTGSALVKQDLWKAAVNASLDAINRHGGAEAKNHIAGLGE
jgi:hypothetical protein